VVVWNDGGREELAEEVRRVMGEVERCSPRWWSWLLWACPPAAAALAVWGFWRNVRINRAWEEQELRERAKL
jgi:dephospho-CoA kinase